MEFVRLPVHPIAIKPLQAYKHLKDNHYTDEALRSEADVNAHKIKISNDNLKELIENNFALENKIIKIFFEHNLETQRCL